MRPLFLPFLLATSLALTSCGTTQPKPASSAESTSISSTMSTTLSGQMRAAREAIGNGDFERADAILAAMESQVTNTDDALAVIAVKAEKLLGENTPQQALSLLTAPSVASSLSDASPDMAGLTMALTADAYEQLGNLQKAASIRIRLSHDETLSTQAYLDNHEALWRLAKLMNSTGENASSAEMAAWIDLARLMGQDNLALSEQIKRINQWQFNHPTHPAALVPVAEIGTYQIQGRQLPMQTAVLLPFDGKYKRWSDAIRDGLMDAYYQNPNRTSLHFYSADPSASFVSTYQQAVADGADLVIGPLLKEQLNELLTLDSLPVKTIALNESQQEGGKSNLIEFSLSTEDEIDSMIAFATERGLKRAVIISEDAKWAADASAYFQKQWAAEGNEVLSSKSFENTRAQSPVVEQLLNIDQSHRRAREIAQLTHTRLQSEPRRRQDVDMVVVFSKPAPAQPLKPLFAYHQAGDLPMYATSNAYRGYTDTKTNRDLNGLILIDMPEVIQHPVDLPKAYQRTPLIRLYAFGHDAYELGQRAGLLAALADAQYSGASGKLSIENHRAKRQLEQAKFRGGRAVPVKNEQ